MLGFTAYLIVAVAYGQALDPSIQGLIADIQDYSLATTGKYVYQPPQQVGDRILTVIEYQTPTGEVGYQTVLTDEFSVSSYATGIEADERTFWYSTISDEITATSTKL